MRRIEKVVNRDEKEVSYVCEDRQIGFSNLVSIHVFPIYHYPPSKRKNCFGILLAFTQPLIFNCRGVHCQKCGTTLKIKRKKRKEKERKGKKRKEKERKRK